MWEFYANKSERLDRLLRLSDLPGKEWLSRQAWDELLSMGAVRVNGRVEKKSGAEVKEKSHVQIELPPLGIVPDEESAQCLWSNADFGFFLKDSALSTYPLMPWERGTFANKVAAYLEKNSLLSADKFQRLADPPLLEGGIVQRLDRDTSGIICVTFNASCKSLFRKVFSEHKIEKTYLTITPKAPFKESETLHYFTSGKSVRATREKKEGSIPALLRLKCLSENKDFMLLEVKTNFGLRHVVRAGLACLGLPLVGDAQYGGNTLAASFHMLHALSIKSQSSELSFPEIKAPIPHAFLATVSNLGLNYSA